MPILWHFTFYKTAFSAKKNYCSSKSTFLLLELLGFYLPLLSKSFMGGEGVLLQSNISRFVAIADQLFFFPCTPLFHRLSFTLPAPLLGGGQVCFACSSHWLYSRQISNNSCQLDLGQFDFFLKKKLYISKLSQRLLLNFFFRKGLL